MTLKIKSENLGVDLDPILRNYSRNIVEVINLLPQTYKLINLFPKEIIIII
jgi:hypothetical protein